ncbi:hypothetical protein [Fluviicola taffensis]|uniref:Uncharacterized protein n=1 Tax=Fluviicola taffensis (strain DSM 16823 / NCIMB 13979 / RW262) TaxID=755732 RepID=F2IKE0_FLUTR|nr:hypothetical protein [Fluviicola taffensis]AEA45066.1 hypothetical protein Fluta_3091 [Fluviicola taffensis DSM 16823]
MTFTTGSQNDYHWIEVLSGDKTINHFIQDFSQFIVDKHLAIICFDSGPFVRTDEEIQRGWYFKNDVAYFDKVNHQELEVPIYDNYDQWLLFDKPTEVNDMDTFVNHQGFSLNPENLLANPAIKLNSIDFWNSIESFKPSKFLLDGDFFIYGTIVVDEIKEIKEKWFTIH